MNIYSKIWKIQNEVKDLLRSEENKFQKYFFFNELQVLKTLKPLLEKHKLVMLISDDNSTPISYEKIEREHLVKYLKKIQIIDVEDVTNSKIEFSFWAAGQNIDIAKAKGSAETYAIKYALSKLFLIPVKDLDDPDYLGRGINNKNNKLEQKEVNVDLLLKKHGL